MALEVGDPVDGTGLSGALADARKKAFPGYLPSKDPSVKLEAEAIIEYFKENAEVLVDTDTGEGTIS